MEKIITMVDWEANCRMFAVLSTELWSTQKDGVCCKAVKESIEQVLQRLC